MEAIGAEITTDDMANVYATIPGSEEGKRICMGSHADSVKNGGNYDGILGVMSAMEVLETVVEKKIPHKHPLTAMIWTNEEGSLYPPVMMSSGVVCYDYLPPDIQRSYRYEDMMKSVSMEDGKKYHSNSRSYYEDVRRISDSLCKKYGLSIIQPEGGKGRSYAEWQAEREGKPTWRTAIRMDIKEAVEESFSWRQFISAMEKKGYAFKLNRKYIALRAPGMERYVRLKSLGENYTEEAIRGWILQPKDFKRQRAGKENPTKRKKLHGLQALYYSYLYQMGVLKRKPKRVSYALRQDIRRLDERIAQMEFLQKHGISTREELESYRKPLEGQVLSLTKERHRLYRAEPESARIQEITDMLKPMRKEIRMCVKIEQHSLEIEQRLREQQLEQEKQNACGHTEKEHQEQGR